MIDEHINNPKSIKYYVKQYFDGIKDQLKGITVIDFPAGNGVTSEILSNHGAKVEAFDLFPEYFMLDNIECKRTNIMDNIPVVNEHADMLICQEGIEHFSDQIKVFQEFNRVLKNKGRLIITTPSISNLSAKVSNLLFESEESKLIPPNEIDDIWMSDKDLTKEMYHGHMFLIGLQKLRILGRLTGFKIQEIKYIRLSKGSLFLFPFIYPFIILRSYGAYFKNLKKNEDLSMERKKEIYKEQLNININPKNLLNKHTFMVFEKEKNLNAVDFNRDSFAKPFDVIM